MATRISGTQDADDPREFQFIRVGNLTINQTVQRALRSNQVKAIYDDFNWNLVEVPTVAPDMTVIEGQQRVSAMQRLDPDRVILVAIIPSATTLASQVGIARGITKGRTPTKGYQDWRMRVAIGYEREVMTRDVLESRHLSLNEYDVARGSTMVLHGVAEIDAVAHWRSLGEARIAIENILDLVIATWPETYQQYRRWDPRLFKAVSKVFTSNPGATVDMDALSTVLIRRTPEEWVTFSNETYAPGGPTKARLIGDELLDGYNACSAPGSTHLYWEGR